MRGVVCEWMNARVRPGLLSVTLCVYLPAAKYNEHLQLEGWKLDKPVQFKNNSNQLVYKVIEFGTFDKKPKWVKHGIQEWQDGTYY